MSLYLLLQLVLFLTDLPSCIFIGYLELYFILI